MTVPDEAYWHIPFHVFIYNHVETSWESSSVKPTGWFSHEKGKGWFVYNNTAETRKKTKQKKTQNRYSRWLD